jgi:hypothetical protein
MSGKLFPLNPKPGIQRDGTKFSTDKWTDGQWMRFYRGKPRTMEGYRQLITVPNVPRGTIIVPNSPNFNVYIADSGSLKYFPMDNSGNVLGALVGRTPTLFPNNANNDWSFDIMFDTNSSSSTLLAYAGQNLSSIDNPVESPIYYGDALASTALVSTGLNTAGNIVVLHPYLFILNNDGEVSWTRANDPTTILNTARITASKLIYGARTRGGNTSPAGLFWSLDSLIRATNVGPTPDLFNFDTIADDISILSNKSVVEYNGKYFWAGLDTFYVYNGVVNELPNDTNLAFFFQNLNYDQRQKVWATKVAEWGEIWWFFPKGATATECNHAVIYNVRENTWYDTPINRSCGDFDQKFQYPIWADNVASGGNYPIWQHEYGNNQDVNGVVTAIDKYIETPEISFCAFPPSAGFAGLDKQVKLDRVEPDFLGTPDVNGDLETGDITLVANGRDYAQSTPVSSDTFTFDNSTGKIDIRYQARLMTLKFRSVVVNGFFEMGQILLNLIVGDGRQ